MISRPRVTLTKAVVVLALLGSAVAVLFLRPPDRRVLSRWMAANVAASESLSAVYSGQAETLAAAFVRPGEDALEAYNQSSVLQEAVGERLVRFYRRDLSGGGSLAYFVALLGDPVHVQVINADGATPGSDATGDTIWTDGQQHLATVEEMVGAPYSAHEGYTLLGAMAFGFHGAARTSDEGSVVINGTIHRVNAGRGVLCLTRTQGAQIGLFDGAALKECDQAIGGGPVILLNGKIANPDANAPGGEYLPFNPLGEDFAQLDWRKKIYRGLYPKTAVCAGLRNDGGSFLVLAVSFDLSGLDFAHQLRDMGCHSALGGDDDTSTQAVWRGAPVRPRQVREVPDALAVYVRS